MAVTGEKLLGFSAYVRKEGSQIKNVSFLFNKQEKEEQV